MSGKNRIYDTLLHVRWILLVFYAGLSVALAGFALKFIKKVLAFLMNFAGMGEMDAILGVLGLIDYTLIAGLVLMVILSGYSNFIERPHEEAKQRWLSTLSFNALKTKFTATIAAISAINLLEAALDIGETPVLTVATLAGVQLVLMLVLLVFVHVEKLTSSSGH
nr:YqhA family protein [uncultured Gellertiella sp.]